MMIPLSFTCQYIDTTAEIFIRKEKLVILTSVERARALECKYIDSPPFFMAL